MIGRLDGFFLNCFYQPIADFVWRYSGKTRFFLAWLCFGTSFVGLSLDIYTGLTRGGSFSFAAIFASPLLILILTYLWEASASKNQQASWLPGFDAFDRFIRSVTMYSAIFLCLLSVIVFFKTGTLGMASQNGLYILYALACASALYFVEAKPPSARLAWDKAQEPRGHPPVRL